MHSSSFIRPVLRYLAATIALTVACSPRASAKDAPRYCFTDRPMLIDVGGAEGELRCRIRTITRQGWGPEADVVVKPSLRTISIQPLCEGIHIVAIGEPVDREIRFLAIDPPPAIDEGRLFASLPRNGRKLLDGVPFTILAMGDSVTNTGDFETMLVMMLTRATGNNRIRAIDRSYPGRSIDAAARFFEDDAIPNRPDLGLLMYGLNDQICLVERPAYVEQYEYVAERLACDLGADTVFLQPTPHIDIYPKKKGEPNPPHFAFRTIGFASALRPAGARMGVPVAGTFDAVWGRGGRSIRAAADAMWPVYPPSYSRQLHSMIETDGRGDTIHPNALGHLAIARATFDAIAGRRREAALEFVATSTWTDEGLVSTITATARRPGRIAGRLEVHPLLDDQLASEPVAFDLARGDSTTVRVRHVRVGGVDDLFTHPANRYVAPGQILIPVVTYVDEGCTVDAVSAPVAGGGHYLRGRSVSVEGLACAWWECNMRRTPEIIEIPGDSQVGRIRLKHPLEGAKGRAAAELAYVRYASALRGEACVDGRLDEWNGHVASVIGEALQARWVRGPEDNRADTRECYQRWMFTAGAKGMYLAARINGPIDRDHFTIFFDPRAPGLLGTAGRYYWTGGSVKPEGMLKLGKGETTREANGLTGRWSRDGDETTVEMFVPYELFEAESFPVSGDLGLSIWWTHYSPDGARTNLMWSEDGHPWNPRWYGVVRLQDQADESRLPYMVRVK